MMSVFDGNLIARILLTVATAGYAFATVLADFNKTHATNPKWTPHARFHVVWQITSYAGLGLLALALIWWPGPLAAERLYLVALMAGIVYAAFFAAVFAMPVYGGAAYDDNGYAPFAAPVRQHHDLLRAGGGADARRAGGHARGGLSLNPSGIPANRRAAG